MRPLQPRHSLHRRRKRGALEGAITVGARMRRVTVVVCLVLGHLFVQKMLSHTQRATEVKQFVEVSLKLAEIQHSQDPPLKAIRTVGHFPAETAHAHYALIVLTWRRFSASYILRATLAREPIFWGGFSPKAPPPPLPPTMLWERG